MRGSDQELHADIETALAPRARLLQLPPALEALYENQSWRGRSRGLRTWLIVAASVNLMCIGIDAVVMPQHLAAAVVARIALSALHFAAAALILRHRPLWVEGLALIVPTVALILVAGYLAQLAGGVHTERYLTAAMFTSFAATIVANIAFRWVVAYAVLSAAALVVVVIVQFGAPVARLFSDHVELLTFYPVTILVALTARRRIERMHRRNFLMNLRDEQRVHELSVANARREAMMANMTHGIVLREADGTVPVINRRAVELLGLPERFLTDPLTSEEIVRVQYENGELDSFPPELVKEMLKGDFGKLPRTYERTRPNGMVLEITSTPLPSGAVVRTYTDITERKHHEQALGEARDVAEAASRARTEFLAIMSHEIRTPMNAVVGFAESLAETTLDDDQRKSVAAIQDASDGLLGILNDILDLSKLDAGRLTFEAIPFSLETIIEDARSLVALRATNKTIALVAEVDRQIPPALTGDPGRIRQILLNLLSNAIKFTNAGSVTVSARCVTRNDKTATLRIAVRDTGIGISPDRVARLFEDFVQADTAIHREYGGTGLGLAICKRLVDQMGGEIAVQSEPGRGSTFWFEITLPVADRAIAPRAAASNDDIAELIARLGRPLRVLVAEDNLTNQAVIQKLLADLAVDLHTVGNGAEAVAAVTQRPFDAVFMDIRMPEMDGLAATRAIRQNGALARLPIIALTANAFPEDMRACREAGMTDFVAKPIRKTLLRRALIPAVAALLPDGPREAPPAPEPPPRPLPDVLLDRRALADLHEDLDPAGVAQLLRVFRDETVKRIARLHVLSCANERTAIGIEAHTLKSAAALVGFARLARHAARLEREAATITPPDYMALLQDIVTAFDGGYREISAGAPASA